jgi:hypothetical protein
LLHSGKKKRLKYITTNKAEEKSRKSSCARPKIKPISINKNEPTQENQYEKNFE